MSEDRDAVARFTCEGCGKQYRWKHELAGRRVKCAKCGAIMVAPQATPIDHDEELYDLVPDSPPPRKHQEFEYNNGPDLGGTGIAMAPPVMKPLAPPRRGVVSSTNLRTPTHRAVAPDIRTKLPAQKKARRLRVTLIVVATLIVAVIATTLVMRLT
ncbi:MAG: hypothetical protein H7Z14_11670 [Anaerolineae bacterium]|nr:hypothetical protein [Phycisphaerae bacterium]